MPASQLSTVSKQPCTLAVMPGGHVLCQQVTKISKLALQAGALPVPDQPAGFHSLAEDSLTSPPGLDVDS